MNEFMEGLTILQSFIQPVDHATCVAARHGQVVVGPTTRRMPFDAVRHMATLGWNQVGDQQTNVNNYDPTRAWVYPVQSCV